ncbi:UNVERIFIED_CONTAM: hypothetical protein Scaly_2814500 [Sesamum calycinum]|uniref:Endonuclease/exonuclease/phosphatase domain-containing protein n=1 Tax=Sesamum calycinum TaxID=2727403 RepID=A0AAW2IVA0_9LAMI
MSRVRVPLYSSCSRELLRTHKPSLVFLAETKCKKSRIETIKRRFDLYGCCVEAQGRSGGLALLWQKSLTVQLQSFGYHHIDATVYPGSEAEAWRFTGFYGIADTARRQDSWDLLSVLKQQSRRAWLIAGDFNEILCNSEKKGGRPRQTGRLGGFARHLLRRMCLTLALRGIHSHGVTVTRSLRLFTNGWTGHVLILLGVKFSEYSQTVSFRSCLGRFHGMTNDISRIKNGDGQWLDKEDDIRGHIEDYFGEIFRSRNPSEEELEKGTEAISARVTDQMLQELSLPFTAEEISKALSQMAPLKSPGPDVYKIASKAIANRLKPLLDTLISPCQAVFVPGRLITDNVLLAFEVNHFLKTKRWGKKGHMALKLDISKAYDKYPIRLLYVLSVWFCSPQRGLAKATPFTLFVLAMYRGFQFFVTERENGLFTRCGGMSKGTSCFHLLFADDTLIFCQATVDAALSILEVLRIFGRAAGQEINFNKSSVVLAETHQALREGIQGTCRFVWRADMISILASLQWLVSPASQYFNLSETEFGTNLWLERAYLSQAGKEVLIKAVAQAIPTYAMGCFRLPISLVKEIQSMVANYWWHNGEAKKIHWLSWKKMCILKALGGMGFRDLHAFNLAMLSKQVWRILLFPNSFSVKFFVLDIFMTERCFSAKRGWNPSFTWRSLQAAIDIVRGGFRWGIGSGRSVKVWQDPWLPRPFSFHILTPPGANDPHLRLCGGGDFFVWHHTANGMFSVKSAYHVAVSLANRVTSPVPSPWKAVWSANVPGKEDTEHVFLRCPFARQVWALSNLRWSFISNYPADPCGWVEFLAQTLSRDDFACGISICWAIWWNGIVLSWNNHTFRRGTFSPLPPITLPLSSSLLLLPAKLRTSPPVRWSPPGLGEVKLNFDGAIFASSVEVGIGIIARDSAGACVGWKSVRKQGLFEPEMVEALAAREAILLACRVWLELSLKEIVLTSIKSCLLFHLIALHWELLLETSNV